MVLILSNCLAMLNIPVMVQTYKCNSTVGSKVTKGKKSMLKAVSEAAEIWPPEAA